MTPADICGGLVVAGILVFVWALATGRNPVEAVARWVGNRIADALFGRGGSPRL